MSVQITDMHTEQTDIDGLLVITVKQVSDPRGTVREFFRLSTLDGFGTLRQINVTESGYGAVRGLHGESTTKLVGCVAGQALGAYLDTRPDSASYGKVVTVDLSLGVQVLVPPGVCNGFQSVSREGSQYLYCFTDEWYPGMPGIAYSPLDEGLGFSWPIPVDAGNPAQISAKDAAAAKFSEQRMDG
ncbi:dTDP-4-dehydrorhamnose 3,5-epimerase family protein [Jatrophihabitans sp.]|uniref:dTDP-4-dehydrorhamnose 3,5-epimerase family protein n=1 Tax=Jatrophihabitans sp. TaxID=1932789 RepID=UPI002BD68BC1|nr:dTDP-4-dehydrorhamnose 3,5-epimerase family protein [Jatrophihabitans sp.]